MKSFCVCFKKKERMYVFCKFEGERKRKKCKRSKREGETERKGIKVFVCQRNNKSG
jgi:hypothetical protein